MDGVCGWAAGHDYSKQGTAEQSPPVTLRRGSLYLPRTTVLPFSPRRDAHDERDGEEEVDDAQLELRVRDGHVASCGAARPIMGVRGWDGLTQQQRPSTVTEWPWGSECRHDNRCGERAPRRHRRSTLLSERALDSRARERRAHTPARTRKGERHVLRRHVAEVGVERRQRRVEADREPAAPQRAGKSERASEHCIP
jgi:hypothetical protein